jgi:hypothetical protein
MAYSITAGGADGCAWVSARTGIATTPRARSVVARRQDGLIRAGVVLDGWVSHAVEVHLASDSPIAWRRLLPEALVYAFRGARRPGDPPVDVLLARVRSDNLPCLRMATHAGFQCETRVKGVFGPKVDLLLLSFRRSEWATCLQPDRMVA